MISLARNKKRHKAGLRRERGFTLIEVLLVMTILVTLAAIIVPKFTRRSEQARETAAVAQIANIKVALEAFEVDNGYYPKGADGLQELIEEPPDARNWRGPYLEQEIEEDPWGNPYVYEYPGVHNKNGYDLMSMGSDGKAGTDDDIANWKVGQ